MNELNRQVALGKLIGSGGPYELVSGAMKRFKNAPGSLYELIEKARKHRDASFIRGCEGGWNSFSRCISVADQLALQLLQKTGDEKKRVGLMTANVPEAVMLILSVLRARHVPVLLPALDLQSIMDLAADLGCCMVLQPGDLENGSRDGTLLRLPENFNVASCLRAEQRPCATDEALIAFTSGSTGKPKAIVHTDESILHGLFNTLLAGAITALCRPPAIGAHRHRPGRPCAYLLSPIHHVSGFMQLFIQLLLGGKVILGRSHESSHVIDVIEEEAVRSLIGVTPPLLWTLLEAQTAGRKIDSLSSLHSAGFALDPTLARTIMDGFPGVQLGSSYGLTETCGVISAADERAIFCSPPSVGYVLPTTELEIVDAFEYPVDVGQFGRIRVRGAMNMKGYWVEGCQQYLIDGWLETGDVGYQTNDGQLRVLDRVKSVATIDEETIACEDVARALKAGDLVRDCAALLVTQHGSPTIAVAFVGDEKQFDIQKRITSFLKARFNTEKFFVFEMSAIPRNILGKLDLAALEQNAFQHLASSLSSAQ